MTGTVTGAGQPGDRDNQQHCGGPKRQSEGTCTRPAGWGTPHAGVGRCKLHGGSTPSHVAAAQKETARLAAQTYGVPREVNPIQAMVELLHDAAGAVAWLREIIRSKEPDALVWGIADEIDKGSGEFPGIDRKHAAAPSVWLQRYDVERRLMLDVSRDLAKLGIEWDAREAIRREGAVLARVARDMARRLGHDPNAPEVVAAYRAALKDALGVGADVDRVVDGRLA
jgi:hypothetical protein